MDLISASYTAGMVGTHRTEALFFRGKPGDLFYCQGNEEACELHFQTLCGFRKPETGTVEVDGQDLYPLLPEKASDLRCRSIGSIPETGGFQPGLSLLDQITIPMRLAGLDSETVRSRIQELSASLLPMSILKQKPSQCSPGKQAIAAIIRAAAAAPKLIVVDRLFEHFAPEEASSLWNLLMSARPENSVILCLGSQPPAQGVNWTKVLHPGTGAPLPGLS